MDIVRLGIYALFTGIVFYPSVLFDDIDSTKDVLQYQTHLGTSITCIEVVTRRAVRSASAELLL